MRPFSVVLLPLAFVTLLFSSLPNAHGEARSTIDPSEIKEGMKGYGLTVFRGTQPEKFDVEAIGVMKNFRAGQDLILVKTPHPRLNITKNVKGMSGSPIYFEGRLAGAYAYSLASFQAEPVAGVTPIAPMLLEMRRAIPPGFWPLERKSPSLLPDAPRRASADGTAGPRERSELAMSSDNNRYHGVPGEYDLAKHAAEITKGFDPVATSSGQAIRASTPLLLAGVGDRSFGYIKKLFEPFGLDPMQTGGAAGNAAIVPKDAPEHYVDGGAIGVQLVRGDISMMGMGTVTHVEGTKSCGFGHPMMNGGNSALPTAIGRVLWIYASDQHSFKVGEAIRPLGALVQDRQSAIVADETKKAPMFPMSVRVEGVESAPRKDWNMEVAEERFMTAGMVASSLGSIVDATISERREMSWSLRSKLTVQGHAPIELRDQGVTSGGLPDAADWGTSLLVRAVGDTLNNPWENASIERIESVFTVHYDRDTLRLRGVELLDESVDPGEKARVLLHLRPYSGPEVQKTISITMPTELAGKEVELEILPGYEVFPDVSAPENLRALLSNAARMAVAPKGIVVQYRVPSQGLAFAGHIAPRLPSFALDLLRPTHASIAPDLIPSYKREVVQLDAYIDGRDRIRVKVRAPKT